MKKNKELNQFNLFTSPKTENDFLWEAISDLKESHNKVRRKLFEELNYLRDSLIETKAQNEKLMAIVNDRKQLDMFSERPL